MGIINKNKAKRLTIKWLMMIFWLIWLWGTSFTNALSYDPNERLNYVVKIWWTYMTQYFSMVHFNVAGNDFWWGFLWLPVEQLSGDVVQIIIPTEDGWTDSVYCSSRIRGLYWNSQRWDNRLWPLDPKTHEWLSGNAQLSSHPEWYTDLVLSWWWYTSCSEDKPTALMNLSILNTNVIAASDLEAIIDMMEAKYWTDRDTWTLNTGDIETALIKKEITDAEVISWIIAAILEWATFQTDPYGIYWRIIHNYDREQMDLIAWVHYDMDTNRIVKWDLTCSLQRLGNNYPFWYMYDDYGHIWIVWARVVSKNIQWTSNEREMVTKFHSWLNYLLNSWICIDQIFWYDWDDLKYIKKEMKGMDWYEIPGWDFNGKLNTFLKNDWNGSARTTVFSLWIKGIIWLTDEVRDSQKEYYENNQLQSTLMLRTETSISNIVNKVNKKAESLCRGKWAKNSNVLEQFSTSTLVCYDWPNDITATPDQLAWKDVVIRWRNLILSWVQSATAKPINLFIDQWNLFIDSSSVPTSSFLCFDDYWYIVDCSESDIQAMFLKGNFVINGLILWGSNWDGTVDSRLFMHWKLVSYNTLTSPTATRKKTIDSLLGAGYWNKPWVSLMKLFTWTCNPIDGIGSDGTSCKWTAWSNNEALLVDKAFWLIDMDLEWDLVKY